jgi:hypothetical protein
MDAKKNKWMRVGSQAIFFWGKKKGGGGLGAEGAPRLSGDREKNKGVLKKK